MKPLPHSETQNPSAIEKLVCEPMSKLTMQPMNNELSEVLLKLMFLKSDDIKIADIQKDYPLYLLYQIIQKRIEHLFTYDIADRRLILFLCFLSETPGKVVLYLWYLQWWCHKNGETIISLDLFASRIFPMGFPSDEDLQTLWYSAKVMRPEKQDGLIPSSDNLLDYASAGKSILELVSVAKII